MNIYMGESYTNKAAESIGSHTVLHKEKAVMVTSGRLPWLRTILGNGSELFIWGIVQAGRTADGTRFKVGRDKRKMETFLKQNNVADPQDLLRNIEGVFVGVIIDQKGGVKVFSDRFNRKDVFYSGDNGGMIVSTELTAIIETISHLEYDQASLASFFNMYGNYAPKKHTIYKGIKRLGTGESITYGLSGPEIVSVPFEPVTTADYSHDDLNRYFEILHSSVESLSSETYNWVYLSSGWDSSSVLAFLKEIHSPRKVGAVAARFKYSKTTGIINHFETERAQKIADYFSIPLEILDIDYTGSGYIEFWEKIRPSLRANQLYALFNYNYLKLAEFVSENGGENHSVFNGEISDGVHNLGFAQNATILDHPDLGFRQYCDKMASYLFGPTFYDQILKGGSQDDHVYRFLKDRMSGAQFDDPRGMDIAQRKRRFVESFFISGKRIPFISLFNQEILTASGIETFRSGMFDVYFKDFVESVTPETLYAWFIYLYNSFHWQGGTVKGFSNAADYFNIDVSMPFWDKDLHHFLSAMPETWGRGLDLNPTKYPLKWVLEHKLDYPLHLQVGPHSYLYDVDPGWSAQHDILYGSAGAPFFKDCIGDYKYEDILASTHFNLGYLKRITDNYCKGVGLRGPELNDLYSLVSLCNVGWYK